MFSTDRYGQINLVQGVFLFPRKNYLMLTVVLVLHCSWGRCSIEPEQVSPCSGWARSWGWLQGKHSSVLSIWWYSSTACCVEEEGDGKWDHLTVHWLSDTSWCPLRTELELNVLPLELKQCAKKQISFGPLSARVWRELTTHTQGLWLSVIKVCLNVILPYNLVSDLWGASWQSLTLRLESLVSCCPNLLAWFPGSASAPALKCWVC